MSPIFDESTNAKVSRAPMAESGDGYRSRVNGEHRRESPPAQDRVNRRIYHAPNISRSYTARDLAASEIAALLKYQPSFVDREVLDIGVGTGRTTWFVAPLARRYVGVDYSPAMVEHLRATMPDVDVRHADMRDLSAFGSAAFDFVFGPCNVVDAVSHEDRLRVLGEASRVLRVGGIFCFSSHNRSVPASLFGPRLVRSRNPATQARYVVAYCRSLINHTKVGRLRRFEEEYALLNDSGHEYAALHYYVTRDMQRKQLDEAGFRLLDVFSASGLVLRDSEEDTASSSLLYVAERT